VEILCLKLNLWVNKMNRLDNKYMELAVEIGLQTNCSREDRKVGAVIVKNGKILSKATNYIPEELKSNCANCCYRKANNIPSGTCMEKCFALCAEQHAIAEALKKGEDLSGATIYVTLSPCAICARWIVFVGIKRVVFLNEYNDEFSRNILTKAKVKIESIKL